MGNPSHRWNIPILSGRTIVDFRINETRQMGRRCFQLRRFNLPRHLCGAGAPTGGESVLLFLESTINDPSNLGYITFHVSRFTHHAIAPTGAGDRRVVTLRGVRLRGGTDKLPSSSQTPNAPLRRYLVAAPPFRWHESVVGTW